MSHRSRSTSLAFAQTLNGILPVRLPGGRQARCSTTSTWRAKAVSPKTVNKPVPATTAFRLAPSDFAFLWEDCKRCFYLKVHKKLPRPRAPFPSIFGNIDLAMKRHFRGLRTTDLFPEMKPGIFLCEDDDAWVECKPITPPGHSDSIYVRGMVDCLVRFDDGTFGIIDFKTSGTAKTGSTYARQLHAYALAMENPSANSELSRGDISDMGLVVYSPNAFYTPVDENDEDKIRAAMTGDIAYVNVERDDEKFMAFLSEVLDVLTLEEAPPAPRARRKTQSSSCTYCQYLQNAKLTGLIPE